MSQIARCPACATMFRVVAEQLTMAHGWVRCGQCGEVFDAGLHLLPDPVVLAGTGLSRQAAKTLDASPSPGNSTSLALAGACVRPDPVSGPNEAGPADLPAQPEIASVAVREP